MTYSEVDRGMLLRCLDPTIWRKTFDIRAIFIARTQSSPKLYEIERALTDLVESSLVEHQINKVGRFSEYRLAPGAHELLASPRVGLGGEKVNEEAG